MDRKKQRIPVISPHFGEHVEIGGFDVKDGIFKFKDSNGNEIFPKSVTIGDSYTKESGKTKILNQIESDNNQINLNPNIILQTFDWLFAIDTNLAGPDEPTIHISCSLSFRLDLEDYKSTKGIVTQDWDARVTMQSAFIFRNPTVNPELVGWQELINRIKRSPGFKDTLKIGIIVDSELGKLPQINKRGIPFIGEYFLPNNFRLIYASSDANMDSPLNKLLRVCDKATKTIWKEQKKNIIDDMEEIDNLFIDGSTMLLSEIVYKLIEGV